MCKQKPFEKDLYELSARAMLAEVTINDGLHLNGIMLTRIDTRLRVPLNMHLDPNGQHYQEYVHDGRPLRRIHVQRVEKTPNVMADYTLKSLKWRIPDLDNVLIFPKTLSELSKLHSGENVGVIRSSSLASHRHCLALIITEIIAYGRK
jgi:hypothetical protein